MRSHLELIFKSIVLSVQNMFAILPWAELGNQHYFTNLYWLMPIAIVLVGWLMINMKKYDHLFKERDREIERES
ncbi:hypothetical protein B003_16095 [Vibrio breoganii 1C10]|nr:hypothetical protein B003_16095 [Vibrio breoganii 1C10]